MAPHYKFDDFVEACRQGYPHVDAAGFKALRSADQDFGLPTRADLLAFIGQGGLEKLEYLNTRLWHNAPVEDPPPLADAYRFFIGGKEGYLAFGYLRKRRQWRIKSFHPPER